MLAFRNKLIDGMKGKQSNDGASYKEFEFAAVVCNNSISSTVGKDILAEGGSVVDAAIASMLTLGVISLQSAGIGGGCIMIYYDAESGNEYSIDGRSIAPLALTNGKFYVDNKYGQTYGKSSIGIPGEILGFWEAHKMFGKLPWSRVFEPAILVAEKGFKMTSSTENWLDLMMPLVQENKRLKKFLQRSDGTFKRAGDIITRPTLAVTLRTIATKGADAFYNGSLTQLILDDIHDGFGFPSVIEKKDFTQYRVQMKETVKLQLNENLTLVVPGAPSGGPVLAYLLGILKGYQFNDDDLRENKILTYHRIIEAMKFAYCKKRRLGDTDFYPHNIKKIVDEMLTEEYCEEIRMKIDDFETHPQEYYEEILPLPEECGTGHLGIVGPDGSAIAMTSTINRAFGSHVYGERTGIIFNDQIVAFVNDGLADADKSYNRIQPGKRSLTYIAPAIILNRNIKDTSVKMVFGGSGGTFLLSSVAWSIIQHLWFNKSIDEAIRSKRPTHPGREANILYLEENMDEEVVQGLKERGHDVKMLSGYKSNVHAIVRLDNNKLAAKVDDRRGGSPDGY
uniref:glutathione hydrolase 1 proenzyme-like n=1 Tax=Styela clava TaxID=7725 RepID=UPI00193A5C07|nr:glutathione hydrolase 1 proenzyme-like [Styela clava]